MLLLKKERNNGTPVDHVQSSVNHVVGRPSTKGEIVIMKDYPEASDWYIAEVAQVLSDCFVVNGYITEGAP
jgi:hypothetical protein